MVQSTQSYIQKIYTALTYTKAIPKISIYILTVSPVFTYQWSLSTICIFTRSILQGFMEQIIQIQFSRGIGTQHINKWLKLWKREAKTKLIYANVSSAKNIWEEGKIWTKPLPRFYFATIFSEFVSPNWLLT